MPKPKPSLNQADFDRMYDMVYAVTKVVVSEQLESLVEKINHLPTKDEFYIRMDNLSGELQTTRQEQVMLSQHDVDQNDRLDRLEDIHPHYSHLR